MTTEPDEEYDEKLTIGHTLSCLFNAMSSATANLYDQGGELTPRAILIDAEDYLRNSWAQCICDRYIFTLTEKD